MGASSPFDILEQTRGGLFAATKSRTTPEIARIEIETVLKPTYTNEAIAKREIIDRSLSKQELNGPTSVLPNNTTTNELPCLTQLLNSQFQSVSSDAFSSAIGVSPNQAPSASSARQLRSDEEQGPPSKPYEELAVPINGNNDHGAAVVKYSKQQVAGPETGTTKEFPGYVPVNYEYDYKTGYIASGDPQVIPINWVRTDTKPIPRSEIVKWKLTYTASADNVPRVKFWDNSTKRVEFQPNNGQFNYTPNPEPTMPAPRPLGIWPSHIEGIDTSRKLYDAGIAQLELEYVPIKTGNVQPLSVFINFKPVWLSVTPVLESLADMPSKSKNPYVWDLNGTDYFKAEVFIEAKFQTKSPDQKIQFVQFVQSNINQAADGFAVVMKPGATEQSKAFKYNVSNDDFKNSPVQSVPFDDSSEEYKPFYRMEPEVGDPNKGNTGFPDDNGSYHYYMIDGVGVTASDSIQEVKYTVTYVTYVSVSYPNLNDPFKTVVYPIAKMSWEVKFNGTNFRIGNNILVCEVNDSKYTPGNTVYQVHQFDENQKLAKAWAIDGFPLLP